MCQVCLWHEAKKAKESTSGPLQQVIPKTLLIMPPWTAPVHSTPVLIHLHSWATIFSVNQGTETNVNRTRLKELMTFCGTHGDVQLVAPVVLVVVHGSLPQWARKGRVRKGQWEMTLKWGCANILLKMWVTTSDWKNWKYTFHEILEQNYSIVAANQQ